MELGAWSQACNERHRSFPARWRLSLYDVRSPLTWCSSFAYGALPLQVDASVRMLWRTPARFATRSLDAENHSTSASGKRGLLRCGITTRLMTAVGHSRHSRYPGVSGLPKSGHSANARVYEYT